MILAGTGALHPAQSDDAIDAARPHAARLNARLCGMARYSEDVNSLASPVTGGALQVGRIEQLFLLARSLGQGSSAEWAAFAGEVLKAQGHRIMRDGKALEAQAQSQALDAQARTFHADRLPILQAFGICD